MNIETIKAYGSEVQEIYERLNEDPLVPGFIKQEMRAMLNRVFKMNIKTGVSTKHVHQLQVTAKELPAGKQWKPWNPGETTTTGKKKGLQSLDVQVAAEKKAADDLNETEDSIKAKIDALGKELKMKAPYYHKNAKMPSLRIILTKLQEKQKGKSDEAGEESK